MTTEELSVILDGRIKGKELSIAEEKIVKDSDLVVLYATSYKTMEFRGSIHSSEDMYDGGFVYLDETGLRRNECDVYDCPYFMKIKEDARKIKSLWMASPGDFWTYKTDIPHTTFKTYEDGKVLCFGIIFNMNELNTFTC